MDAGLASHCRQQYAGRFEILFGVGSADDPAVEEIARLRLEFPQCDLRLIVCPERLGTSGKVSNLVQMLREAKYDYVLINDSDICVSRNYLTRVMRGFVDAKVGMVTALYRGRTAVDGKALTLWARLEALGISTDFMAGVLAARKLEGGIHFGLGSTLAMSRAALAAAGGLEAAGRLAGRRLRDGRAHRAGRILRRAMRRGGGDRRAAYNFHSFWSTRFAGRGPRATPVDGATWDWDHLLHSMAVMNCMASGFALWSFTLLSLVVLARVAVALTVGVGLLGDAQVLRDIWLLPLRDCFGLGFWAWSYASDTIVWRVNASGYATGELVGHRKA